MGNRANIKRRNKYRKLPVLTRFEVMVGGDDLKTEAAFFDAADARSIRPAGGTWTGRVSLVSFGGEIPEVAMLGSVDAVAKILADARK